MVQGLCASHCATTCHVCTSFQYVDGEMLSTSFLCWFSMYFLHFSMNYHFKKKWNPTFAIILKKIVCNLAKFCHALYEINYLLGVVINRTFGSAKLNICGSVLPYYFANDCTIHQKCNFNPPEMLSSLQEAWEILSLHSGQKKKPQE